jgi:nucleotide-binding universal stress UspA family protein
MAEKKFKALICIDGSKHSDKVVKDSSYMTGKLQGHKLTLVNVVDHPDVSPENPYAVGVADLKIKSQKILDRAKKVFEKFGQKCETKILVSTNVADEIVNFAEDEDFDYIVVGTRGLSGLKRILLGSVADKIIRHAHCPVVVIR